MRITRETQEIIDLMKKVEIRKNLTDIGARLQGSNSYPLIKEHGFTGILADMNAEHCKKLESAMPDQDVRNLKVSPENVGDLVSAETGVLMIDIDGNDYWVWKAITVTPEVVIIETGKPRKVPSEDWIAPFDEKSPKRFDGTSDKAMTALAEEKGYKFYKKLSVNMIYLRNDVARTLHATT